MASYQIKSDLSEKQIEADVAMYLGWCSGGLPFRLIDVDEQLRGADKLLDVSVPVYIQFKKSTGLKRLVGTEKRPRANESKLQKIRRFRQKHELADDPTLYFPLRKKAKTAVDLQHNILFAHHRPNVSYAVYVAPTYLDRSEYYNELTRGPRNLTDPWDWRPWELHSETYRMDCLSRYDRQPFLRNHVSITPHKRVSSHAHHYAYSCTGDDISWHSPEVLDGGISRFSDFMSARARDLLLGETMPHPEECLEIANEFASQFDVSFQDFFFGETPIEMLQAYGRWLRKTVGIRQILLCADRKRLNEVRSILLER